MYVFRFGALFFIIRVLNQDVMDQLQLYVEPLMVKYNVTIGIYGHNHAYQRHCASYKSQCMQHSNENTVLVAAA